MCGGRKEQFSLVIIKICDAENIKCPPSALYCAASFVDQENVVSSEPAVSPLYLNISTLSTLRLLDR